MNDQNPTPTSQPEVKTDTDQWKTAIGSNKNIFNSVLDKFLNSPFYKNKKLFWPVMGFFGIVMVIVVTGLLFGKKETPIVLPDKRPTPTPFVRAVPSLLPGSGFLYDTQQKLIQLKTEINALDPEQNRLQPPALNFDIKF